MGTEPLKNIYDLGQEKKARSGSMGLKLIWKDCTYSMQWGDHKEPNIKMPTRVSYNVIVMQICFSCDIYFVLTGIVIGFID